MLRVPIFLQI
uniref:Uncharacterized protein n=1 Tax=Anguilla anguilla TaxID=7936 RepID=A0A0E9TYD7_ANGAN